MIILVGASASGKTEIAKRLSNVYGMKKVVTVTTRAMRVGERQDVDYHFVSEEQFLQLRQENAFVETATFSSHHYGSLKKEISDNKVLIVEPRGLKHYQELHDPRIVSFALQCGENIRKERMTSRGDAKKDIEKRLENDRKDFFQIETKTDYVLDSSHQSIEALTEKIIELYQNHLQHLPVSPTPSDRH